MLLKYKDEYSLLSNRQGFTLLELLVSATLLAILAILSAGIVNSLSSVWREHRARLSTFEGSRVGFELLSGRLAQATLNTYWDYNDPARPTQFIRQSDLHFTVGKASQLLGVGASSSLYPMDGVFFTAPLGFTQSAEMQPLVKMLTACGFFVYFSDDPARPAFLEDRVGDRFRYRLYQYLEPGEKLSIFTTPDTNQWFSANTLQNSFPMVDNVIGLVIRATYPTLGGNRTVYRYDSRDDGGNPLIPGPQYNQLPPTLSITMVAIDEATALRLSDIFNNQPPPIGPEPGHFSHAADFEANLLAWEEKLRSFTPSINYRIFTADIPIRGAKWSSD